MITEAMVSIAQPDDGPECRYYLIEGAAGYGVGVEDVATGLRLTIPDIARSRERIMRFIEQLSSGGVTPLTFPDIVEDWLSA